MKIKAAIVGLGRMGAEPTNRFQGMLSNGWDPISHAESIKSTAALDLAALCDIDREKTEKFAGMYDVPGRYSSFEAMISEVKPEIISIATRTNFKGQIINYGLSHGVRGFYVEKPLSNSIAECEEIINKIESAGAKIVYGAQRRAMGIFRRAKELCYSGAYGDVEHITFEYGRNMLLWSHAHTADLTVFFANSTDVDSIAAQCTFKEAFTPESSVIDTDPVIETAFITFKNGITVNFVQGRGNNIRIHLTNAIINVNGDGYSVDINSEGTIKGKYHNIEREFAEPQKSGTQVLFEDLANAVLHSTPVVSITPEEIVCGTKILTGIVESALLDGQRVNYDDIRKDLIITGRFGELYA